MVPDASTTALVAVVLGFITATITTVLSHKRLMAQMVLAVKKVDDTHAIVNSRMDEFKALLVMTAASREAGVRAEGVVAGAAQERGRPPTA